MTNDKPSRIILGVSASIALYKSCDLVRECTKKGISVSVLMTKTAASWINPVIFEALSGNQVYVGNEYLSSGMQHIFVRKDIDLFLLAPLSANALSKIAIGSAEGIVYSTILSYDGPKWVAPAMNPNMYKNYFIQKNLEILKKANIRVLEPQKSSISVCGEIGQGNMLSIEDILTELNVF